MFISCVAKPSVTTPAQRGLLQRSVVRGAPAQRDDGADRSGSLALLTSRRALSINVMKICLFLTN